jgi:hypothetical protein
MGNSYKLSLISLGYAMTSLIDVGAWSTYCNSCGEDYEDPTAQFSRGCVYSECPFCKYIKEQEL